MEIISPAADTPNNEPKYPKGLLSLFVEPTSICPMIAAPIKPTNIKITIYIEYFLPKTSVIMKEPIPPASPEYRK